MGRFRLADRIAHVMLADDGYDETIIWGDGLLNDAVWGHVSGRMSRHPLDRMILALNAMERAPDLFEKMMVHAHDSRAHQRVVRGFRLIGTPRPHAKDAVDV